MVTKGIETTGPTFIHYGTTEVLSGGEARALIGFDNSTISSAFGFGVGGDEFFGLYSNGDWRWQSDRVTGNFGIGISNTTPSARLHVKGSGPTSATYAVKVDNSSSTAIFQVRNDGFISAGLANGSMSIGLDAGFNNTLVGNTFVGVRSGNAISTGINNTGVGGRALESNVIGDNNTALGRNAGNHAIGSGNVFLGYHAGNWQTAVSDKLFIDNQDRFSSANELTQALVYGVFAATPDAQKIRVNAVLELHSVSSGYASSESITKQAAVQTPNETTTTLATIAMSNGEMISIEARVNGHASDFSAATGATLFAVFRKNGGTVTQVDTTDKSQKDDFAVTPVIDITTDGTAGAKITVASPAVSPDVTVNWVTTYSYFKTLTNA